MLRILFVDDEPAVLGGMRRMLHDQRGHFELAFAGSGAEALQAAAKVKPDVIVSDMRMPGMDGAALLKEVRQLHPEALRIILSGQTDWKRGGQNVEDAHLFLNKPCEKAELLNAIQRVQRTSHWVIDGALRGEIAQLSRLPMLGPASRQLLAEMERPGASLKKAAELIEQDPGLAALALKMIHSAFFSTRVRVERPAQAALLLGLDNLKGLILGSEPFHSFGPNLQALADRLWHIGSEVAFEARAWAMQQGATREQEGEAFTAGMLHEVGVLALATLRPQLASEWEALHGQGWPGGPEEAAHFGGDHAAVGGYLLSLWGLSEPLAQAVALHHSHSQAHQDLVQGALQHAVEELKSPIAA